PAYGHERGAPEHSPLTLRCLHLRLTGEKPGLARSAATQAAICGGDAASHTRTAPSTLPATIRWPSGEKATLLMGTTDPLSGRRAGPDSLTVSPLARCARSIRVSRPVAASHTRTVPSTPPVRMRRPSAEKPTAVTAPVCP